MRLRRVSRRPTLRLPYLQSKTRILCRDKNKNRVFRLNPVELIYFVISNSILFQSSFMPFSELMPPTTVPCMYLETNSLRGISLPSTLSLKPTVLHLTQGKPCWSVKAFCSKPACDSRLLDLVFAPQWGLLTTNVTVTLPPLVL